MLLYFHMLALAYRTNARGQRPPMQPYRLRSEFRRSTRCTAAVKVSSCDLDSCLVLGIGGTIEVYRSCTALQVPGPWHPMASRRSSLVRPRLRSAQPYHSASLHSKQHRRKNISNRHTSRDSVQQRPVRCSLGHESAKQQSYN